MRGTVLAGLRPVKRPRRIRQLEDAVDVSAQVVERLGGQHTGLRVEQRFQPRGRSRLESGRTLASLEDALEKTLEFERFALTRRALRAVKALVEIADTCPVPQDVAQTDALLAAVDGTMKMVHEVPELPMMVSQSLAFSLGHTRDTSKDGRMLPDAYRALGDAAKVLKGALSAKLAEDEGALAPVRERLAAEVLLLDDADLRKLERHRKLLETAMQRQLGLLDQLRVQVAAVKTQNPVESKELRVRLRLVK
jgi:hypothetical protein